MAQDIKESARRLENGRIIVNDYDLTQLKSNKDKFSWVLIRSNEDVECANKFATEKLFQAVNISNNYKDRITRLFGPFAKSNIISCYKEYIKKIAIVNSIISSKRNVTKKVNELKNIYFRIPNDEYYTNVGFPKMILFLEETSKKIRTILDNNSNILKATRDRLEVKLFQMLEEFGKENSVKMEIYYDICRIKLKKVNKNKNKKCNLSLNTIDINTIQQEIKSLYNDVIKELDIEYKEIKISSNNNVIDVNNANQDIATTQKKTSRKIKNSSPKAKKVFKDKNVIKCEDGSFWISEDLKDEFKEINTEYSNLKYSKEYIISKKQEILRILINKSKTTILVTDEKKAIGRRQLFGLRTIPKITHCSGAYNNAIANVKAINKSKKSLNKFTEYEIKEILQETDKSDFRDNVFPKLYLFIKEVQYKITQVLNKHLKEEKEIRDQLEEKMYDLLNEYGLEKAFKECAGLDSYNVKEWRVKRRKEGRNNNDTK